MKKNLIKIKKRFLIFRDEAKKIKKASRAYLTQNKLKLVELDFAQVDFFSRSFADELLKVIYSLNKEKIQVKIINLKPELKKILNIVKKTRIKP